MSDIDIPACINLESLFSYRRIAYLLKHKVSTKYEYRKMILQVHPMRQDTNVYIEYE